MSLSPPAKHCLPLLLWSMWCGSLARALGVPGEQSPADIYYFLLRLFCCPVFAHTSSACLSCASPRDHRPCEEGRCSVLRLVCIPECECCPGYHLWAHLRGSWENRREELWGLQTWGRSIRREAETKGKEVSTHCSGAWGPVFLILHLLSFSAPSSAVETSPRRPVTIWSIPVREGGGPRQRPNAASSLQGVYMSLDHAQQLHTLILFDWNPAHP